MICYSSWLKWPISFPPFHSLCARDFLVLASYGGRLLRYQQRKELVNVGKDPFAVPHRGGGYAAALIDLYEASINALASLW